MQLDDLIGIAASNRRLAPADVESVSSGIGVGIPDFLDLFARTVAMRYLNGEYSFGFADMAVNQLFAFAVIDTDGGLPEVAWQVYCAFDEGEYMHEGPPCQGEANTRRLLGQIPSLRGA